MKGFFPRTELSLSKAPPSLIPKCGQCGLKDRCHSPKMPVSGKGRRGILIVEETPDEIEDDKGRFFSNEAGNLFHRILDKFDVDLYNDCWTTSALICKAPRDKKGKITFPDGINYCRPNLLNTIQELSPQTIILLGEYAVKSLIGWLWREDVGSINRWIGWTIPCQKLNAWIAPAWHPAYILRGNSGKHDDTMQMIFEQHVSSTLQLEDRPWPDGSPDYSKRITLELDHEKAGNALITMIARDKPVVFDYETDRLKPDHKDATIVSCAVSNGEQTIAFPWFGEAIKRMGDLLSSPVPKIGQNIKFEDRWTRRVFGHRVRNWQWDTMLAAHVLDNRSEISGFKFQAFVNLGVDPWDETIGPYLKAKGGANSPNRIKEVGLPTLLRYNAMDALLEWEVAQKQMKLMERGG